MSRAGKSVAALTRALAPHAERIWVACGPGNNGGDGLVAARHLMRERAESQVDVVVTLCADARSLPLDAARALAEALAAGVVIAPEPPDEFDIGVDALLGIGARDTLQGPLADHLTRLHSRGAPVLSVDLPSGLLADTGRYVGPVPLRADGHRHTLSLLTLKPGLFTADGRDIAGTVWYDPLGDSTELAVPPDAILARFNHPKTASSHADHKGSRGDVVVVGGQSIARSGVGMTGAAVLAARAALHAGSGRVYVALLNDANEQDPGWDPHCPELMFRSIKTVMQDQALLEQAVLVCGCGGGMALTEHLPAVFSASKVLVLDADGLNRTSEDSTLKSRLSARRARGQVTVITPHPLEAARLLGCTTQEVMADRLWAARALAEDLGVICVLKGSGTVVAAPDETPHVNSTGNPSLATAGTGDVLAGWIGASLAAAGRARSTSTFEAVVRSVHAHGLQADRWIASHDTTLTAHRLVQTIPAR